MPAFSFIFLLLLDHTIGERYVLQMFICLFFVK